MLECSHIKPHKKGFQVFNGFHQLKAFSVMSHTCIPMGVEALSGTGAQALAGKVISLQIKPR